MQAALTAKERFSLIKNESRVKFKERRFRCFGQIELPRAMLRSFDGQTCAAESTDAFRFTASKDDLLEDNRQLRTFSESYLHAEGV